MYVAFFYGITLLTEIGVEDRCGFLFNAGSQLVVLATA
jgi:hypothetical protein